MINKCIMRNIKLVWYKRALLLLCFFSLAAVSCVEKHIKSYTTLELTNKFILQYGAYYYLWADKMNYDRDLSAYSDPFQLFDNLIYHDLDKWSYLTSDSKSLFESFQGIETSYGYSLSVINFSTLKEYAAVINFVYPDSPASKAGLKRGDLIYRIDGSPITESNYMNLFYSTSMTIELGEYDQVSKTLYQTGQTFNLTAVKLAIDAVNESRVIEAHGKKIGYICYTDYVESSHAKMSKICSDFKADGVTDVILDLRFNPGGAIVTANYISSLFVPSEKITSGAVFLHEVWNKTLTDNWKLSGNVLFETFSKQALDYNMNLDRIYILTTSGTASASEATIVGLMPYMDVVTIGENTHGKYCAALLLQPYGPDGTIVSEISNWAMNLVAYKFANNDGFTDFTGGLEPDYPVTYDILTKIPLGDTSDPMIAKAIELITGVKPAAAAAVQNRADGSVHMSVQMTDSVNGFRGGMKKIAGNF